MSFHNKLQQKNSRLSNASNHEYAPPNQQNPNQNLFAFFDHEVASKSQNFQPGAFRKPEEKKLDSKLKRQQPEIEIVPVLLPHLNNSQRSGYDDQIDQQKTVLSDLQETVEQLQTQMHQDIVPRLNHIKKQTEHNKNQFMTNLNHLAEELSRALQKRDKSITGLTAENDSLRKQFYKVKSTVDILSRQFEEKFELIFVEMNSSQFKKSKPMGEYSVDLKSSTQNAAFASSSAADALNSKTLHELLVQIDSLKKELDAGQASTVSLELKLEQVKRQSQRPIKADQRLSDKTSILQLETLTKLMSEKLQKRLFSLEQKLTQAESKVKAHEKIHIIIESNIQGINDAFADVVNNKIFPKIKVFEAYLADSQNSVKKTDIQAFVTDTFNSKFKSQMDSIKVLHIRDPSQNEKAKLSAISQSSQVSYRETYLLDEENFLMDSKGVYLVEQVEGEKRRIKIEEDLIYLMQASGLNIVTAAEA